MSKEDPLHRLSRTQTKASHEQQYYVWKEAENERTKDPHWKSPLKPSTTPHYAHDGHINHHDPAHRHTPIRVNYTSPKKETPAKPRTPAPSSTMTDVNGGGIILFDELCHWMATNESDWAASATEDEAF
jgi:hypothetical protein